jgi:hypothetical protein
LCRQVQRGGNAALKRRGPVTGGVGTSLLPTVAIPRGRARPEGVL